MLNVLYVEDDPASREVMRMVQRSNPGLMQLTMFEHSQDFTERLLALPTPPEIIFLDIHMKPYTGFEMLAMIRQQRAYDGVPVLALTASVMNEEVAMLKQSGFDGVLAKPLDLDTFPEAIERAMQGEKLWYVM